MVNLLKNKKTNEQPADSNTANNEVNLKTDPEKTLESYKDLEGMTIKKLKRGLWWVQNRTKIIKFSIVLLIIVSILTWSLFIFTFGYYLIFGIKEDEKMSKELADIGINHDLVVNMAAKNLQIMPVDFFENLSDRYDFLAYVVNPNEKFYVEFDYYFLNGNKKFGVNHGYVLPGENKYFVSLDEEFNVKPSNVEFRLENIAWQRINPRKYPDWEGFKDARIKFEVSDINFTPAKTTVLTEKLDMNELKFNIKNLSIYNYWQTDLVILLYGRNDSIVGVNKYNLVNFLADEDREIVMTIPGKFGYVGDVKIIPDINIVKDDIYIKYDKGPGEVK